VGELGLRQWRTREFEKRVAPTGNRPIDDRAALSSDWGRVAKVEVGVEGAQGGQQLLAACKALT